MSTYVAPTTVKQEYLKTYVTNSMVLSKSFAPRGSVASFCGYGGTFAIPKGALIKPSTTARKPVIEPANQDTVAFSQYNDVFSINGKTHIHYSVKVRNPKVKRTLNHYNDACTNAKDFTVPKAVRLPGLSVKVSKEVYHCRYQYLRDVKSCASRMDEMHINDPEARYTWPPVQFRVPYSHIAHLIKESLKGKNVVFLVNTKSQMDYEDVFPFYGGTILHESRLFNNGNYNTEDDYMKLIVVSFKE